MKVSLLTGGKDPHYALGILSAIADKDVHVDFIGNDAMEKAEAVRKHNVKYYNLRGDQDSLAPLREKVVRVLKYYGNLMKYAAQSDSRLFHILWLNKFVYFDGTFLHLYYKLLGKKLVYTAHNINMWERDGGNNFISKIFLKVLYRSVNHIFVHTEKMKRELVEIYGVGEGRITVIPFGVNGVMPKSCLSRVEARKKLGLIEEKVILFFGNIAPYKGLENLIKGFIEVKSHYDDVKLIIAGSLKCPQQYWEGIQRLIRENGLEKYIIKRIEYIPDAEVEVFLKAADIVALPYKKIFQSGVLFLAYNFGLPVIAANVGSLREEVVEGETGFICQPENPGDLAEKIILYFKGDLYRNLEERRIEIYEYANKKYSWNIIGDKTYAVYGNILRNGGGNIKREFVKHSALKK